MKMLASFCFSNPSNLAPVIDNEPKMLPSPCPCPCYPGSACQSCNASAMPQLLHSNVTPMLPQCLPMFVIAPPTFASVNQKCLPMAQCLSNPFNRTACNPFNRTASILIVRHCLPTFAADVCNYRK